METVEMLLIQENNEIEHLLMNIVSMKDVSEDINLSSLIVRMLICIEYFFYICGAMLCTMGFTYHHIDIISVLFLWISPSELSI